LGFSSSSLPGALDSRCIHDAIGVSRIKNQIKCAAYRSVLVSNSCISIDISGAGYEFFGLNKFLVYILTQDRFLIVNRLRAGKKYDATDSSDAYHADRR